MAAMSNAMQSFETVIAIAWTLGGALTLAVPWIVGIRLEDSLTPPTRTLRIFQGQAGIVLGVVGALRILDVYDADITLFGIPLLTSLWMGAIWRLSTPKEQDTLRELSRQAESRT
jgi:hypothetical protein